MIMPFNDLSPAEDERLALLIEECSEVIQAATKILRHGYASYNPFSTDRATNRQHLAVELGHVAAAVQLMAAAKDIDQSIGRASQNEKLANVPRWLHHQDDPKRD